MEFGGDRMAQDKGGSDLGTVIVAGAVGAAVGAVVALLLAPKPGGELRAELGEKAKEYVDIAKEKASEVATAAREKVESIACEDEEAAPEEAEATGEEPAPEPI